MPPRYEFGDAREDLIFALEATTSDALDAAIEVAAEAARRSDVFADVKTEYVSAVTSASCGDFEPTGPVAVLAEFAEIRATNGSALMGREARSPCETVQEER